jgi:hypothetical protein
MSDPVDLLAVCTVYGHRAFVSRAAFDAGKSELLKLYFSTGREYADSPIKEQRRNSLLNRANILCTWDTPVSERERLLVEFEDRVQRLILEWNGPPLKSAA